MGKAAKKPARSGGRPSVKKAEELRGLILTTAREMFLTQGYGATSIDAIAQRAGIAKRTFYVRFKDKADLFGAVLKDMLDGMQQTGHAPLSRNKDLREALEQYGRAILNSVLMPESLALYRLLLSEASRFPELAAAMDASGARREAIRRISELLQHHSEQLATRCDFAAEQFLYMIVTVPQRRALGLGQPMSAEELNGWLTQTVGLLLHGYRVNS